MMMNTNSSTLVEEFPKLKALMFDVDKGTCLGLYCFTLYSASFITFRISTKFLFVTHFE